MALCEEEQELWWRYREQGDPEARDYLFLKYSPWARRVAGGVYARLRVPQMEWADFTQNAMLGMLEAMGRFDPGRGLDFIAYAKLRVRGAVFNGVRVFLTGTDRATDPLRYEARLESLADSRRSQSAPDPLLGFADTVALLGTGFLLETAGPPESLQASRVETALRHQLLEAMDELSDRERLVLSTHYLDQIQFQEIAAHLGLTKGRVSQIHKAGLGKLRELLVARRLDPSDYL